MIFKLIDSLEYSSASYIRRDICWMLLIKILRDSSNRFKCFMICESWFYWANKNINRPLECWALWVSLRFLLLFRYNYLRLRKCTNRKNWLASFLMCFNSIESYCNLFKRSIKCYCYIHILFISDYNVCANSNTRFYSVHCYNDRVSIFFVRNCIALKLLLPNLYFILHWAIVIRYPIDQSCNHT